MAKKKSTAEGTVRNIRRKTRKQYSAEEKIRIVIEGLRGDMTVAELCRKEGIAQSIYYKWSKEFLEAGKSRLAGNIKRQADSEEVTEMRKELEQLKMLVAELSLKNRTLKKSLLGLGRRDVERLIRRTPEEKMEIIHLVEHSDLSIKKTLAELDVPSSTFYRWYQKYQRNGLDGLSDKQRRQDGRFPFDRTILISVVLVPPPYHSPPPSAHPTPLRSWRRARASLPDHNDPGRQSGKHQRLGE